jgi:predicted porin
MKRNVIAIAALCTCIAASAQSSVGIFGIIDTAYQRVDNSGGTSVSRLVSGSMQTSRIGFRATEDLGGGLTAGFWLEGALLIDDGRGGASNSNNQASGAGAADGGLTFGRRATVSLAGGWGEVRLGRDFVPGIWNVVLEDPFTNVGVGASQAFNSSIVGVTQLRASNMIGYFTPQGLGGFFVNAAYWMGENASNAANADDGTGAGIRVGYAGGPFEASASINRTQYATGDARQDNIGGSWNFGAAKVSATLQRDRSGARTARGGLIGVAAPIGSGLVRASYSRYHIKTATTEPQASKLALGYVHNLSKRTALYTTIARVKNADGASAAVASGAPAAQPGRGSTGLDVGIRHTF